MDFFEELTNPNFNIVERAAKSRNRGLMVAARSSDAESRLPKVLSIGDAKSLYDHLHTETSGGANDRRTAIVIQIIRSSMEAQGATVRWVDHGGMYADAMTKRNGNIPLLQTLTRTGRICITEEVAIMGRHQLQPSSRSSSSKTRVDPAAQSNDDLSRYETRWSGNTHLVNEAQNQKKILRSCQLVIALVSCVGFVPSVHVIHLVVFVTAHSLLCFSGHPFCALWKFYLQGP